MLIRYGYEIKVTCEQPTAMVCLLSLSEDRKQDVLVPEVIEVDPPSKTSFYHDVYGNRCLRLVAPAGDLVIRSDATIADDGQTDLQAYDAQEIPVAELPDACLIYLLGSRYCETDRLSQLAWDMFGTVAPGWGRVQAICDFVHHHIHVD